jgi:hypothetical protein
LVLIAARFGAYHVIFFVKALDRSFNVCGRIREKLETVRSPSVVQVKEVGTFCVETLKRINEVIEKCYSLM